MDLECLIESSTNLLYFFNFIRFLPSKFGSNILNLHSSEWFRFT